jgi:hypothetical protein
MLVMNREVVNPYAVPEAVQQSPEFSANEQWFELSDDGLICGSRPHLPRICMRTGQDVGEYVKPVRFWVYSQRKHRVPSMVAAWTILLGLFFAEWYSKLAGFAWPLIAMMSAQAVGFAVYAMMMHWPWGRSRVLVAGYYTRTGVWRGLMVGVMLGCCFGLVAFPSFYIHQWIGGGLATSWPLLATVFAPVVESIVRIVMKPPHLEVRPDGLFELRGFRPELLARLRGDSAVAGESGTLGIAEKAGSR